MFQVLGKRLAVSAASALVCAAALIPTPASALTVTLSGTAGNSCTYSGTGISIAPDGNVTVTCQGNVTGPGTVALTTGTLPDTVVSGTISISVSRTNGSTGNAGGTVSVTAGSCAIASGNVAWSDNDGATKSVTALAPSLPGTCSFALGGVTGASLGSPSVANVNVVLAGGPGSLAFSTATYGPVEVSTSFTAVINRSGGSSGTVSTIVTGSGSCSTGSPQITFAPGEVTKSLSVSASGTQGTCTLNLTNLNGGVTLGNPSVATATVNASNSGGGGNPQQCATSPPGVLSGTFAGEGQWQQPFMGSGQIISFPLINPLPGGVLGGVVTTSQTAITPSPLVMELSISRCPGDMEYGKNEQRRYGLTPCYQTTQNPSGLNVSWHTTVATHYAYCYAPASDGPWYVNLRLTFPSCAFGNCGVSVQWNRP